MKPNNPYSLSFGKLPSEIIPRTTQTQDVLEAFLADNPSQQIFMISGVRGSGKTVFMTNIAAQIRNRTDWITVELNPEQDLLFSLAAKLCSDNHLARLFQKAKINLSVFGLGFEIDGTVPIKDIETALTKMLQSIKKQGKRLLITIDEVTNSAEIRRFSSAFQIFLRQELPLFLLMTGLYENIDALQNEKTLTFLHRAPKIALKPLNIGSIAESYRRTFHLEENEARLMAQRTRGYSFAFQVLGYFSWEYGVQSPQVYPSFKQYLDEYVYEKIWSELSEKERRILFSIAQTPKGKIRDIREKLDIDNNHFNPYRKRLIRRGLIDGDMYGYVFLTLPLFGVFVLDNTFEEDTLY